MSVRNYKLLHFVALQGLPMVICSQTIFPMQVIRCDTNSFFAYKIEGWIQLRCVLCKDENSLNFKQLKFEGKHEENEFGIIPYKNMEKCPLNALSTN